MKSIIWKIELAAAVLLAVSALVWGLRPGVWNYGGFYRMAAGEQGRTYTRPGCSTVEVTEDNRLRIRSPAGQTAEFTLSLAENGSYRAAEMAMDGVVRNVTYNTATGTFMTAGDSWSISTLVQEKAGFSPGLTDNALYSMALGNHQTRIAGRPGEFLTAGLFLLLGLVLPLLLKPAIALDKFLLGFFYDNTEKLQATDLARGIMLLLGLVVSVIGAIWWCILLFGYRSGRAPASALFLRPAGPGVIFSPGRKLHW